MGGGQSLLLQRGRKCTFKSTGMMLYAQILGRPKMHAAFGGSNTLLATLKGGKSERVKKKRRKAGRFHPLGSASPYILLGFPPPSLPALLRFSFPTYFFIPKTKMLP